MNVAPPPPEEPEGNNSQNSSLHNPITESDKSNDAQVDNSTFAAPAFDVPPKKKGKLLTKIIVAVSAVIIVAASALAVYFNYDTIAGFAVKTFGDDNDYLRYVESREVEDAVSSASGFTSSLSSLRDIDGYANGEFNVVIGDKLSDLLRLAGADAPDLKWINDLSLSAESNTKDGISQSSFGLNVSGDRIITLDSIIDMPKQSILFRLNELSDEYIELDYSEILEDNPAILNELFSNPELLEEIIPDEKTMEDLAAKYIKIVFDNIEDVESKKTTLKLDGIKQTVTELEYEIDSETLLNIAEAVLKEARDDEEIEKIIEKIQSFAEDIGYDGDISDEFDDEIDDLLDDLDESREYLDESDDESCIVIHDYVNSKSEIIGRSFEVNDNEMLRYMTVREGKKFAFEFIMNESYYSYDEKSGFDEDIRSFIEVSGSGTEKNDLINGEYSLYVRENEMATIEVEDYNSKLMEEGYLNGTFRILPSSELVDEIASGDVRLKSGIKLLDPWLELKFEDNKNASAFSFNLMSESEILVGFNGSFTKEKAKDITIPKEDFVDASDDEAMQDWLNSLNTDKVKKNISKTKLPETIIAQIENLLDNLN